MGFFSDLLSDIFPKPFPQTFPQKPAPPIQLTVEETYMVEGQRACDLCVQLSFPPAMPEKLPWFHLSFMSVCIAFTQYHVLKRGNQLLSVGICKSLEDLFFGLVENNDLEVRASDILVDPAEIALFVDYNRHYDTSFTHEEFKTLTTGMNMIMMCVFASRTNGYRRDIDLSSAHFDGKSLGPLTSVFQRFNKQLYNIPVETDRELSPEIPDLEDMSRRFVEAFSACSLFAKQIEADYGRF